MARQLVCQVLSSSDSNQPFLIAICGRCAAGNACRMPKSPSPRTLRIVSSSHCVHFGPAARPSPMHWPSRTTSRADMTVWLHHPCTALESVRLHTLTIFVIPGVPPMEVYVRSAASLSLSRIMISRSPSLAWVGESLVRRYWAAIHALINDAVDEVASILEDPKISLVRRSSTAQLRNPVVFTESTVMFAACSGNGAMVGPAAGLGSSAAENGPPGTNLRP